MKDNDPRWIRSDHVFVRYAKPKPPIDPKVAEMIRRREYELLRRFGKI
jgi:hypothetical protein